jgi:signal transduction histidine kinase/CheY-like chemotaxis protein
LIAAPAFITLGQASFDFQIFLLLVVAAITANNTTTQTPRFSLFMRFFVAGWCLTTLTVYFNFPDRWGYVLATSLAFSVAAFRQARVTYLFYVKQLLLEERSAQSAANYKDAKEQAEQALASKSLFLITASHDLRQPMHAMSMLVEAIAQRNRDPAVAPLLADLKSGMGSMNMMFNSLLDLSKLEAGALAQREASVRVQPMLKDLVTMFREQASQRGLTLRLRAPKGDAAVWADPALLRQALVNLVHNALRYTERGGLLIGLRRRGITWQIEVWDTGVGIADEEGSQIFSPYFRSEHAWSLHRAGHGLGLAVVARCAGLMGATIGFQSRLGTGSRFWLRLPQSQHTELVEPPASGTTDASASQLEPLSGCCLVLDDDLQVIAAWKALFDGWGVTGRYATTAHQALQLPHDGFAPDAIFCDQRLRSGESGFEVLKALLNRYPQAGGAMVSGEFHSKELQDAENEGYLVLRKPLEPTQLHAVLSTWLAHKNPAQNR